MTVDGVPFQRTIIGEHIEYDPVPDDVPVYVSRFGLGWRVEYLAGSRWLVETERDLVEALDTAAREVKRARKDTQIQSYDAGVRVIDGTIYLPNGDAAEVRTWPLVRNPVAPGADKYVMLPRGGKLVPVALHRALALAHNATNAIGD